MGLFKAVPTHDDALVTEKIRTDFIAEATAGPLKDKDGSVDSEPRRAGAALFIKAALTGDEKTALTKLATTIGRKHGGYSVQVIFQ